MRTTIALLIAAFVAPIAVAQDEFGRAAAFADLFTDSSVLLFKIKKLSLAIFD